MSEIRTDDFIDVRNRARELALGDVGELVLLPVGFAGGEKPEPTINQESATIRKLLAEASISAQVLGECSGARTTIQKSADWIAPMIFVGAGLWSQNPVAVEVAISVIGSYAADLLKGGLPTKTVKLSIAVESKKGKQTKLLTYEGPVDGLTAIASAVERIANE